MSFDFSQPTPLREAVSQLSARTPIGSVLRTLEWERMPLALRQRAQFSAGVTSVRVMKGIQDRLMDAIQNVRQAAQGRRLESGGPGTFKMDRQKFVADVRALAMQAGLAPQDDAAEGGLTDITSEARLNLIWRTQMEQARGHAYWKRGQKKTVLNAWPAQELIRVRSSKVERDWASRWRAAGGEIIKGRMAALKDDPIWKRISRFGTPWPPFDFNSGMGLREMDREEAIALGLIDPEAELEPVDEEFNRDLEASLEVGEEWQSALKTLFGDQVEFEGGKARWVATADGANEDLAGRATRGRGSHSSSLRGRDFQGGMARKGGSGETLQDRSGRAGGVLTLAGGGKRVFKAVSRRGEAMARRAGGQR